MNKKFKIIITSKNEDHLLKYDDFKDFDNISLQFILNNTTPITKIYNDELTKVRLNNDADFIIFMHSDVKLDVKHLIEHILQCENKYDVMGLCGAEHVNVSISPLNWFTASRNNTDKRWGCVTHTEFNSGLSYFSKDRPNILDHHVALIDGLCIIFTKRAIDSDIKFDETFLFDQYDTDISLQSVLIHKLRLGCLVEKSLIHTSIGMSITKPEFLVQEKKLRKKWNF